MEANASTSRPHELFLPSTFEERGAVAPFTTPSLTASRVRPDDRVGLLLVLPNFGGTAGNYVIPWKVVPEVTSMTVHDRHLHEKILEGKAATPDDMRRIGLTVAATGLAGPLVADAAKKTLHNDEQQKLETHFFLILRLLQMLKIDHAKLLQIKPDADEWRGLTKGMLLSAAKTLKVEIEEIYSRLEEISGLIAPVGLIALNQKCRLRRLLFDIGHFRDTAREQAGYAEIEASDILQFGARVAEPTIEIAVEVFNKLDAQLAEVPRIVADWANQKSQARAALNRLSWLLDGWEQVIALWSGVEEAPPDQRDAQLPLLLRMLPLVPRDEGPSNADIGVKLGRIMKGRRIKNMVEWRTGRLDAELASRIEKLRAVEVAPKK